MDHMSCMAPNQAEIADGAPARIRALGVVSLTSTMMRRLPALGAFGVPQTGSRSDRDWFVGQRLSSPSEFFTDD
jgi:hypothetical protein